MEAIDTNVAASSPAPATPPAVPATPPVATAPVSTTPQTSGGNSVLQTMKNLKWVEVGFGILGAAALYYAIYYYRYSIKSSKAFQSEFQNKIDDINIKISDVSSTIKDLQSKETEIIETPQIF
jgi:hypothetical protein